MLSTQGVFSPTQRAVLSFHRLLALRGVRADPAELLERCPEGADPSWFAQRFAEHGLSARVVQCPPERLRSLRVPAFLPMKDGSAVLLTSVGPLGVTVERHDGLRQRIHISELTERYAGTALEELVRVRMARQVFALWTSVLLSERRLVIEAFVLSLLLALVGLASPWLASIAIDRALPDGAHALLALVALATCFSSAVQGALGFGREKVLQALDLRLQTTALREMFARLLLRPYAQSAKLTVGEQMQSVDSAERTTQSAADLTFGPALDLMLVLSYASALFWIAPSAGLLAAGLAALTVLLSVPLAWHGSQLEHQKIDAGARTRGLLHELIAGATAVKAAGAAKASVARWFGLLIDERVLGLRRARTDLGIACLVLAMQQLATLFVIGFGGYAALSGALSLGSFAAAWMLVDGLNVAVGRLTQTLGRWASYAPHVKRINALLASPLPELAQLAPVADGDEPQYAIVLDGVWFRYGPEEPWILKDYSLRVRPNELFTLSGASGQGKTTVLRLIAGLLIAERGTVRVNGLPPTGAANHIAYLPQDAYLLEGSLLANLMLMSGAPRERVLEAAVTTGLSSWTRTLPMGLETVLPPGGGNLSGGQRQWVVLTAAVASQRPILLLDEALSHLDHALCRHLTSRGLFEGKTVVAVSHEATN